MALLQNIHIRNFRGFDALDIDGFSKINLFVGKNNSGKTSVLEAIFLLFGSVNPRPLISINKMRGLSTETIAPLKYLFHNLAYYEKEPSLSGTFNNDKTYSFACKAYLTQSFYGMETTPAKIELDSLEVNASITKKGENIFEGSVTIDGIDHWREGKLTGQDMDRLHCVFLSSNQWEQDKNVLLRYSEIVKKKGETSILKALQAFDKRILTIQALPDGLYFSLEGIDELVPANLLGEGMRRFLTIITTVSEKSHSFILIDEIENGLHHSAYRLLWKSLISLLGTLDVQLFISTHNIEVLSCLKSVLEEKEYACMQDYAKVFTIADTAKAGYKAYRYSFDAFRDAIEKDIELRN